MERDNSMNLSRSGSLRSASRTTLIRRNQSMSAKQIRFYRNGDRFFNGLKLAVSPERYKELDALLAELSSKLELSSGAVRYIFNGEDGSMITDISQLHYGIPYVCSSTNTFKQLEVGYGKTAPQWALAQKNSRSTNTLTALENSVVPARDPVSGNSRDFIKPKLVTVIRNGKPPQKKVTMLLNNKTAISLDQVLDHLSAKGSLGKVDKLYSVDRKLVKDLRDLFDDDTVFIAFASNEKFPEEGIELDPNSSKQWQSGTIVRHAYQSTLKGENVDPRNSDLIDGRRGLSADSRSIERSTSLKLKSSWGEYDVPHPLFAKNCLHVDEDNRSVSIQDFSSQRALCPINTNVSISMIKHSCKGSRNESQHSKGSRNQALSIRSTTSGEQSVKDMKNGAQTTREFGSGSQPKMKLPGKSTTGAAERRSKHAPSVYPSRTTTVHRKREKDVSRKGITKVLAYTRNPIRIVKQASEAAEKCGKASQTQRKPNVNRVKKRKGSTGSVRRKSSVDSHRSDDKAGSAGRHGYFVYVHEELTLAGKGRPTAFVKPQISSREEKESAKLKCKQLDFDGIEDTSRNLPDTHSCEVTHTSTDVEGFIKEIRVKYSGDFMGDARGYYAEQEECSSKHATTNSIVEKESIAQTSTEDRGSVSEEGVSCITTFQRGQDASSHQENCMHFAPTAGSSPMHSFPDSNHLQVGYGDDGSEGSSLAAEFESINEQMPSSSFPFTTYLEESLTDESSDEKEIFGDRMTSSDSGITEQDLRVGSDESRSQYDSVSLDVTQLSEDGCPGELGNVKLSISQYQRHDDESVSIYVPSPEEENNTDHAHEMIRIAIN